MNIDWSKAPEGTTGAMVANFTSENNYPGRVEWIPHDEPSRGIYSEGADAWTYYEAPKPWEGEGLPPIGIECEVLWSSTTGEYVRVRVVGHDEDRAVVRFTQGERKGEYGSDQQHDRYQYPIFRPIRTIEQIAVEERELAIAEIVSLFQLSVRKSAETLYDAGYRKP